MKNAKRRPKAQVPLQQTTAFPRNVSKVDRMLRDTAQQALHHSGRGGCSPLVRQAVRSMEDPMHDAEFAVVSSLAGRYYSSTSSTFGRNEAPTRTGRGQIKSFKFRVTVSSNTNSLTSQHAAYLYGTGLGDPINARSLIFGSDGTSSAGNANITWHNPGGTMSVGGVATGLPNWPSSTYGTLQAKCLGFKVRLVSDQRAISDQQGVIYMGQFPSGAVESSYPGLEAELEKSPYINAYSFDSVMDEQTLTITPSPMAYYGSTADPAMTSLSGYLPDPWVVYVSVGAGGVDITFEIEQKILYFGLAVAPEHAIFHCGMSWDMAAAAILHGDQVDVIPSSVSPEKAIERRAREAEERASAIQVQATHSGVLDSLWGAASSAAPALLSKGLKLFASLI